MSIYIIIIKVLFWKNTLFIFIIYFFSPDISPVKDLIMQENTVIQNQKRRKKILLQSKIIFINVGFFI